jgi:signal peptidase I
LPRRERGAGIEGEPFELRNNEFFAMGDNSPRSQDSRWWTYDDYQRPDPQAERAAVVPRRNLIGKAFFVYWPAAGARYGIPWRFVPDLTEFRFIR